MFRRHLKLNGNNIRALLVMGARDGIPAPVDLALWLMVVATIWSGFHYLWQGIQILRAATV